MSIISFSEIGYSRVSTTETVRLQKVPIYQVAIDQLSQILMQYTNWEDELSLRLFKWGANVFLLDPLEDNNEIITDIIKVQLTELKKILVNPLDNNSLIEPRLDQSGWTWETWMEHDYRKLCQIFSPETAELSPFDKSPMVTKTHDFAIAILNWIKQIPSHDVDSNLSSKNESVYLSSVIQSELNNSIPSQSAFKLRFFTYISLAQKAVLNRKLFHFTEDLSAQSHYTNQLRVQIREIQESLESRRLREAEHEFARNVQIESITQTHQNTVRNLNQRINETDQRLDRNEQILSQEQAKNIEQMKQIQALRERIINQASQIQDLSRPRKKNCLIM